MPITLEIQLLSKVEMPFHEARSYIQENFPLKDTDEGFILSASPAQGIVTLEFNAQDALTPEQEAWLHTSTFAACYVDGYEVKKPLETGQHVMIVSAGEEHYQQYIGWVGKIIAVDRVPFDDVKPICIVEFADNEVAPFYEDELEQTNQSPTVQAEFTQPELIMLDLAIMERRDRLAFHLEHFDPIKLRTDKQVQSVKKVMEADLKRLEALHQKLSNMIELDITNREDN